MSYKISGTASDNSRIYVLQNDSLVGYKDNNYGSYEVIFDSITSSGVTVIAESTNGEVEGYGGLTAISTEDAANLIESDPCGLLKTGQTISYASGDDGDLEKGLTKSYTDNGDGTVTDNNNGLMWAKDGNGDGCLSVGTTWAAAISFANGLDFAGHTDWRLPNINELFSLVVHDANNGSPYIDTTYFPNTFDGDYWSSTSRPGNTSYALEVYFYVGTIAQRVKTDGNYDRVRCVRGGV